MKKRKQFIAPLCTIMKISFLQLTLTLVAATYTYGRVVTAQELLLQKVSISAEQKEIKLILSELESIAKVKFVYSIQLVPVDRKVSISVMDKTIAEVLDELFMPNSVSYKIVRNKIVLKLEPHQSSLVPPETIEAEKEVKKQINIRGKVTDEKGGGLPGVSIVERGTQNGTTTNTEGEFALDVEDKDAVLIFSFIGYKTQEAKIDSRVFLAVSMSLSESALKEVVVVGYGTVRKSNLTSAIAKVSGEQLTSRPVTRVDQALQGQMAGVQVQQSGGKPGKNATIRVRGVGSITAGNDPLYVIDGFPVDAEAFANTNMENIESIEVLKDAASAAIYGSRGSNGVILVTTKRGSKGTALKLNFNAYTGVSTIERKVKMLNSQQYMSFVKEARDDNYFQSSGDPNVLPINRALAYRYDQTWVNNPDIPTYDMQAAILQTGKTQSYQISATGSTEKSRYMISGEYYDQSGIVKNTNFTRYSFRSNVDVDITKFLTVGLNLTPYY
ncbi:MAG: SusC/RagA family TonB-linked outer membrane protein, partial [Taibaiella sp.]